MTKQIERAYRSNRRRSWVLIAAVAALAAAIAVPIASGAAEKNYTMAFSPSVVCGGTTDGTASSVLTLSNTAKSASLGSARITFPAGSVHSVSFSPSRSGSDIDIVQGTLGPPIVPADTVITLSNLNLAKGTSLGILVTFKTGAFDGAVSAVVKQSNDFNDSQGGANLFENPISWPQLTIGPCTTIEGIVWHDRDEQKDVGSLVNGSLVDDEPKLKDWTVRAYHNGSLVSSTNSLVTGAYSLTVPKNKSYLVCVDPPGTESWGQTAPSAGPSCSTTPVAQEPVGRNVVVGVGPETGVNFGNVPTLTAACGDTKVSSGYTVELGTGTSNCGKTGTAEFSFDSWTSGAQTYFKFVPFGAPAGKVSLVEKLLASFLPDAGDDSPQARLVFDDDLTDGVDPKEMPYCKSDPRNPTATDKTTLNTTVTVAAVLPAGFTSCILETAQTLGGSPVKVNVTYYVFSSVDGYRAIPG